MSLIPEDLVSQVIDRNDIVEVIGSYVPLKKAGRNFKTACPFHNEKTPSFVVNPDKQIFHCFGCHVGGNVVSFVMMQEKFEFPEAIRMLAQRVNIRIPEKTREDVQSTNFRQSIFNVNEAALKYYHKNLISDNSPSAKKAREYLKERHVNLEMVKAFNLGLATDSWDGLINEFNRHKINLSLLDKAGLIISRENSQGFYDRFRNRIIFPIIDTRGNCRAFGARTQEDDKDKGAKYINSPETPVYTKGHHLYGFHFAKDTISKEDFVVVVEGYMDCIMAHQVGVKNIVASLGTALTIEQIRLLRRYTKNVVMLFDMDQAGVMATVRSLDLLIEEGMTVRVASLEEGFDPDSFIVKYGKDEFIKRISGSKLLFDFKMDFLMKSYDPKDTEGKAKIAAEMLVTINQFNNEVIKTEYIHKLSGRLNVQEQALLAELKKIETQTPNDFRERRELTQSSASEQPRAVEFDILRLLLEEESFIKSTREHINPDDFKDERIRSIITRMFELSDQGKKVDIKNLIKDFSDQNINSFITKLLTEETRVFGDKDKLHKDYINRIKQDKAKSRRRELLQEMHEAETCGDQKKLNNLREEFNQLIKQG